MAFTDLSFLFVFLPVSAALWMFLQAKKIVPNLYILIISLIFYAWGSIQSLFILLFELLWNWFGVKTILAQEEPKERKAALILCVGVNLLVLFIYKYLNVWIGYLDALLPFKLKPASLFMPAGLSFYMFSCLSYVFDVYNGKAQPLESFVDFGVYAAFFGRVNMGPIAHYARMKDQLENHPVTGKLLMNGAALFLQGLFMKVILADNFYTVFTSMQTNISWLGTLIYGFSYFFQLYFDFAGYSRMARGIGCFFGFEIPANFNLPYTALSVQDFWRRWHISLTDWFRDYVYIPLGGNRVSQKRWILNIMAVWMLTGIWHGAQFSFLVWGAYQGGLILLEKFWLNEQMEKVPAVWRHVYLIAAQLIGWTFFFSPGLIDGLKVIGRYFFIGIGSLADSAALFALKTWLVLFVSGIICAAGWPAILSRAFRRLFKANFVWVQTAAYVICLIVCIAFLISATRVTFLYAAF